MTDVSKDLDETRRLLYGTLAAGRTKRWELVGTLTNALTHHTGLVDDPYELIDYLCGVVETDFAAQPGSDPRAERVRELVAKLGETT